jgi:hypothetical protein
VQNTSLSIQGEKYETTLLGFLVVFRNTLLKYPEEPLLGYMNCNMRFVDKFIRKMSLHDPVDQGIYGATRQLKINRRGNKINM